MTAKFSNECVEDSQAFPFCICILEILETVKTWYLEYSQDNRVKQA